MPGSGSDSETTSSSSSGTYSESVPGEGTINGTISGNTSYQDSYTDTFTMVDGGWVDSESGSGSTSASDSSSNSGSGGFTSSGTSGISYTSSDGTDVNVSDTSATTVSVKVGDSTSDQSSASFWWSDDGWGETTSSSGSASSMNQYTSTLSGDGTASETNSGWSWLTSNSGSDSFTQLNSTQSSYSSSTSASEDASGNETWTSNSTSTGMSSSGTTDNSTMSYTSNSSSSWSYTDSGGQTYAFYAYSNWTSSDAVQSGSQTTTTTNSTDSASSDGSSNDTTTGGTATNWYVAGTMTYSSAWSDGITSSNSGPTTSPYTAGSGTGSGSTYVPFTDGSSTPASSGSGSTSSSGSSSGNESPPNSPTIPEEPAQLQNIENQAYNDANSANASANACFASGTPIRIPGGWKKIEDIRVGDLVLSRDDTLPDGPIVVRRVETAYVRTGMKCELWINGRVIVTTPEHPFHVHGGGWTTAGALTAGMKLDSLDGPPVTVNSVRPTVDSIKVHNMTVSESHTYFVGEDTWGWSVWSHNYNGGPPVDLYDGGGGGMSGGGNGGDVVVGLGVGALVRSTIGSVINFFAANPPAYNAAVSGVGAAGITLLDGGSVEESVQNAILSGGTEYVAAGGPIRLFQNGNSKPPLTIIPEQQLHVVPSNLQRPAAGDKVYRVYGGDANPGGASWSPTNPADVPNYRQAAGLPSGGTSGANNTGRFVIEATLQDASKVVKTRPAVRLDGNPGGIPEYIIPNGLNNGALKIDKVGGVNPEF